MVESRNTQSLLDRILFRKRSKTSHSDADSLGADRHHPGAIALDDTSPRNEAGAFARVATSPDGVSTSQQIRTPSEDVVEKASPALPPPAPPPPAEERHGEESAAITAPHKPNVAVRFWHTAKDILFSSWINVLLVFVPAGIAVQAAGVNPTVVFALNAIAIIPLAGLLSHATESVASRMGDTVGALMNVTFGNAVELIIFMYVKSHLHSHAAYKSPGLFLVIERLGLCLALRPRKLIALVKNEIRIVQASLLGSILANLLLILGMCFLVGGLRFREQIYNSNVTQLSACLLSLSVMSLLLPTAFHASFTDVKMADRAVLQVSRGTSVVLLLVYVLYLLFQLKSHAYLYASTPQHVIDEESHPGVLAEMLGSSSSSDTSSQSEGSDTDVTSGSNTTAKRIKRAFRGRRRRKSSASSKDTPPMPSAMRTPSVGTHANSFESPEITGAEMSGSLRLSPQHELGVIASGDEADTDVAPHRRSQGNRGCKVTHRDFGQGQGQSSGQRSPEIKHKRKAKRKHKKHPSLDEKAEEEAGERPQSRSEAKRPPARVSGSARLGLVSKVQSTPESPAKRPFNLRGLSVRPALPSLLASTVFSDAPPAGPPVLGPGAPKNVVRTVNSVRRTTSLPDRLNQTQTAVPENTASSRLPYSHSGDVSRVSTGFQDDEKTKPNISRTTAVVLLLVSTGLVAICAEFLVGSINYLVGHSGISEAFVGLIILPIIGNAAEHVTAVTVATKNKMDLAIGVAVGSSIQIALFVTPVIVLLGWILSKAMSLYFSLFETVSLFVSAFIVNYLVLDGRSNYLEGALLIAAYVIIAVSAFFYPDSSQQSPVGGA